MKNVILVPGRPDTGMIYQLRIYRINPDLKQSRETYGEMVLAKVRDQVLIGMDWFKRVGDET